MNEKKYVVFKDKDGREYSVTFPIFGTHSVVAARIGDEVVSAGFAYADNSGKYVAYGRSITLNIGSREEDTALLNSSTNKEH